MENWRAEKIKFLLKEEVARRAPGASVAFVFMSTLMFIYHFNTSVMAPFVRAGAVMIFLAAILRLLSAKKFLKEAKESSWKGIQFGVWINALGWGLIVGFSAWELQNQGLHFTILITIMTGTLAGSLLTLSNFNYLYLPLLYCCMIPASGVAFYYSVFRGVPSIGYLLVAYLVFTLYQYIQFKRVRELQIDRLKTQLDLEESLVELKESKEAFVEQTAKLFHASKLSALGEMAGGLSHEVNNSLMRIQGSVDQLDRYFQRDGIKNEEYLKKIACSREGISQIKSVVEGLGYFSQQGDEGEKVARPLDEIIQRTLNFCNEMIKANEIQMFVEPVPPVMVHCNPMQITQILFYLTKNAFDALEGISDPTKRWIRISFVERQDKIEIRVMNGGPLMGPEVKSRLFQPFFTTKEVGKGTGLSLSISRGIAIAHKGEIYLDDSTDYTTFALKIPAAPQLPGHHA